MLPVCAAPRCCTARLIAPPSQPPTLRLHLRLSAADSHASDPLVALKHMACAVTPPSEPGGVEEVTFLYKLCDGACPKSYGTNVARLAGLPDCVVRRAAAKAAESEAARQASGAAAPAAVAERQGGGDSQCGGGGDMEVDGTAARAAAERQQGPGTPGVAELLRRVQAACKAAAAPGSSGAAAIGDLLELQEEVRALLLR